MASTKCNSHYRPKDKAGSVTLAGSFNDWATDGQPMAGPDAEGRYTTSLTLKPGVYQYKFVLDGKKWRADPGNPTMPVSIRTACCTSAGRN